MELIKNWPDNIKSYLKEFFGKIAEVSSIVWLGKD